MRQKRNRLFQLLFSAIIMLFVLSACTGNSDTSKSESTEKKDTAATEEAAKWSVTQEKPIFIDTDKKEVQVYATVNGKYLVSPTRHGLNWVEGNYGDQAVLKGYARPVEFADALKAIDGTPAVEKGGDATKEFAETAEGKFIKGDLVKVNITWEGAEKVYDINEVMVDSTGKELAYRFGGNWDASEAKMTGCYMCFDSCPVGIISNSAHHTGTFDGGEAEFHGNPDVLPEDGTPVLLTYSIDKE